MTATRPSIAGLKCSLKPKQTKPLAGPACQAGELPLIVRRRSSCRLMP